MKIQFWGTRGSIAAPGPATIRYGGNTSCVELRAADGTLIVLDCGTGAYGLGKALAQSGGVKKRAARLLHVSFRSFRYRLEKLGVEDPKRED